MRPKGFEQFFRSPVCSISVLVFGGQVLIAGVRQGFGDLTRSLQSVSDFRDCCYQISVGGYLLISVLLPMAAALVFVSVTAFLFVILKKPWIAAGVSAVFAGANYLFYRFLSENAALNMLEARVAELREKGAVEGFEPWILYDMDFNAYYGDKPVNRQRLNAMIAILFMVFLCAGIQAYEKQSGVVPMLKSTRYGRAPLLHRKLVMAGLAAVFVWVFVWIRELWQYISIYGTDILDAPVRNLPLFSEFPFNVSIRGYFMILYGMRLAMLIPVGWAVLCLSYFASNIRMSYLFGTAVLVLPALFTVLGVSFFQWFTPLIPVSAAELLLGLGQGKWWCVFAFVAWIAVGHVALKVCINKAM